MTRADAFIEKHIGKLIGPPDSLDRIKELGRPTSFEFEVDGDSWRESSADIVIAGLGWISITGTGRCVIKLTVPEGTEVGIRPALLPYEAPFSTAKFTGGRLLQKSRKPKMNPNGRKLR